jgi:hypothetical protein
VLLRASTGPGPSGAFIFGGDEGGPQEATFPSFAVKTVVRFSLTSTTRAATVFATRARQWYGLAHPASTCLSGIARGRTDSSLFGAAHRLRLGADQQAAADARAEADQQRDQARQK